MGTLASGSIDLKSLKVAGEANKYITYIDSDNGIRVYDGTLSNGDQVNFVKINSDGMQIYKGGSANVNKVAEFSSAITIGNEANNLFNIKITDQAVSNHGPGILLKKGSQVLNEITADGMSLYDDNDTLLLKISGSQLDYAKITDTSNVLSIRRNDNSKYYITSPPSIIYGAYATDLDFYTIDKTISLSYMSSLTNGSKFILFVPLYCNLTTSPGWYYNQTLTRIYTKGTAYNDIEAASINNALLSISYDGNMTFTFTLTNNENTSLGYGPAINYYPISIGPSFGHIGNYQSIAGHLLKGNDSFSFNLGIAQGQYSFAINMGKAFGYISFAAGQSHAVGNGSVALGRDNVTFGNYGFVSGERCQVFKNYGIAMGLNLRTISEYQTIFGKYNQEDSEATFIIGNGVDDNNRSNIFTITKTGNLRIKDGFKIINETGNHLQLGSNEISFYTANSNTPNLSINTSGIVLGKEGTMQTAITPSSFDLSDIDDISYFNIEDLRDLDGTKTFTEQYSYSNLLDEIAVVSYPIDSIISITNGITSVSPELVIVNENDRTNFFIQGENDASGNITYKTRADVFRGYTFGTRSAGTQGNLSYVMGYNSKATNDHSIAIGQDNACTTRYAITIGQGLTTSRWNQLVLGTYNQDDNDAILILGNGEEDSERSNALTVNWNGGVELKNGLTQIYNSEYNSLNNTYYKTDGYHAFYATDTAGGLTTGSFYVYGDHLMSTVPLNMKVNGTDYPVQGFTEGSKDGWYYRKWSGGKVEAWYRGNVSCSATAAAGNVYRSTYSLAIPNVIFSSAPIINLAIDQNASTLMSIQGYASSKTAISGYVFRSGSSSDTYNTRVSVYAWTN